MAREKKLKIYTFKELSPQAKKRAIEDFREDHELTWDQGDSENLSDIFEQDLEDHYGLGDMEVGWNLGYSQGDGVCFYGSVDVEKFIKTEEMEKKFGPLVDRISAKITNPGRNCHWNSMDVEVENHVREDDLTRPEDLERIEEFEEEAFEIRQAWRMEWSRAKEESMAPIREWEKKKAEREIERQHWAVKRGVGPRAWLPGEPRPFDEPQPEPLPIPLPKEPEIPEPANVKAARARVESAMKKFEELLEEFRAYLDERIKDISREMEKAGYAEIEYHSSDEYITERLENMDWEFLEDGKRWEE